MIAVITKGNQVLYTGELVCSERNIIFREIEPYSLHTLLEAPQRLEEG